MREDSCCAVPAAKNATVPGFPVHIAGSGRQSRTRPSNFVCAGWSSGRNSYFFRQGRRRGEGSQNGLRENRQLWITPNGPAYLIVGKGRWGARMHAMLVGEGRRAEFASGLRRSTNESSGAHESRLAQTFSDSSAQIAWLCVPPGAPRPDVDSSGVCRGLARDRRKAVDLFAGRNHYSCRMLRPEHG